MLFPSNNKRMPYIFFFFIETGSRKTWNWLFPRQRKLILRCGDRNLLGRPFFGRGVGGWEVHTEWLPHLGFRGHAALGYLPVNPCFQGRCTGSDTLLLFWSPRSIFCMLPRKLPFLPTASFVVPGCYMNIRWMLSAHRIVLYKWPLTCWFVHLIKTEPLLRARLHQYFHSNDSITGNHWR